MTPNLLLDVGEPDLLVTSGVWTGHLPEATLTEVFLYLRNPGHHLYPILYFK